MALNDDKKKRDPLQQQYAATRAGFDAATAEVNRLKQQQASLRSAGASTSILMPRMDSFRPAEVSYSGENGTGDALKTVSQRLGEAQGRRQAFIPQFNKLTNQFKQQTALNQTNAALARVGAAPISPPSSPASQAPAVAAPQIKFAGTDAMPDSMFKSPIQSPPKRQAPSQRMTDNQANAAEVNARTATQPASPPTGMGVPAGAGGAAPGGIVKSKDRNGNTVYTGTGAYAATGSAISGTIGSVQNQNFGNAAVPQAQASIAQPRVASTFGLGVNDPRLNDQTPAIASPNAAARGFGLASADGMSRYYANKEDREAAKKLYDSMDTEAFRLSMAANNPGRRGRQAMETLSALRGQQAKLIGDQANNTAAQISDNTRGQFTLANTGMEQAGQTQRQQMAGDVASQGQFLDYDAKNRATNASLIEKPQYVTDAQGRYLRVGADGAAPVTDASGAAIQMPQTTKVDNDALSAVNKELTALINNPPEMGADATPYNNRLTELRAQQSAMLQPQAKPPAGYPNAKQAPDGKWYVKKDGATYLVN